MEYLLHLFILIGIYIILSLSLNLLVGYAGLLSISQAAFYGIGAYVTALMSINLGTPFLINIFASCIISGILGFIVGFPSIKIHDDYFFITTFAFQIIIFSILNNWVAFTGGPMGLIDIPPLTVLQGIGSSKVQLFIVLYILLIIVIGLYVQITKSPFGRSLKAIREDEVFAASMGKNVFRFKIITFIISSVMASIAGVIYAYYIGYIDPSSFSVTESIFILSIVIIGGAGSITGSIIATIIMVVLPEFLRFLGFPYIISANIRQIIYGFILIAFMIWRPKGILGNYSLYTKKILL